MTNTTNTADLRAAAQAVVDRWDTPTWKDAPATAEYINRLRAALAAPAQAATAKQSPHPEYDKGFSDGWNRCEERQAAAPAGMEPVAWIEVLPGLDGWFLAYSFNPDAKTEPLYTASQVQAMLAAVPRNATLYDPDEVAFPPQRCADGVDALPPELASTSAAKKGGQHGAE